MQQKLQAISIITIVIITTIVIIILVNSKTKKNFDNFKDLKDFKDLKNVRNYISKIFVINLLRRPERLQYFSSNYNLEIPFEVFNAIDGKNLILDNLISDGLIGDEGIKSLSNHNGRKYHYELTHLGSIGCYLSHYYIWTYLTEPTDKSNHYSDSFLIFEDDTNMENKIDLNEINNRISTLPENWDIYLLISPDLCYSKTKIGNDLYKVNRFFCSNAYIINNRGILKIFNTDTLFPINQQIDSHISELAIDYDLNIYVHNHKYNYYYQKNFLTDIQNPTEDTKKISFKRFIVTSSFQGLSKKGKSI
jgi:GR25 family glycosyltransferase involved in LPS biosynthesis